MVKDTLKYFLQGYLFKICLAVCAIVAIITYSGIVTLALIFHYHYDPILPLVCLAVFWSLLCGVIYFCYWLSERKLELELSRALSIFNNFKMILTVLGGLKSLFKRKSK